jgi:hypothetical protein
MTKWAAQAAHFFSFNPGFDAGYSGGRIWELAAGTQNQAGGLIFTSRCNVCFSQRRTLRCQISGRCERLLSADSGRQQHAISNTIVDLPLQNQFHE